MLKDTIIAISTPFGFSGIGIVRLSGKESLNIIKKIFKPKNKNESIQARKVMLGTVYNPANNEPFEEAFLTYFPSPNSYTTEDMIELSCHGSPVILEEIVKLGIHEGARHAKPGEFTLRAYLNGRLDIIQAEAINDLIRASSLNQAKISYRQMSGILSKKIKSLKNQLIKTLSEIEARLEFPDENLDLPERTVLKSLEKTIEAVKKLIKSYDIGKSLSEGLKIAIVGKTNVGKSTLFNALLESERAIVTPYPGTTRDYLSEKLKIKDSIFTLLDMAGQGKPNHPIEKEGMRRSEELAQKADGILLVLDSSRKKDKEDRELLNKYKPKKTILVFNKCDLSQKINIKNTLSAAPNFPFCEISALKKTNIQELKKIIYSKWVKTEKTEQEIILHLHQKLLLADILKALEKGKEKLQKGFSEEIYAEEIKKSIPPINQLTGEIRSDDIIDSIFQNFCIGK
jgi:tRNA modification GTPase